jgi:hypothetical protein
MGFLDKVNRALGSEGDGAILITKSPSADSRSAKGPVSKSELLRSTKMHIEDVKRAMAFVASRLSGQALSHDHTKISGIDGFHEAFEGGRSGKDFKSFPWWNEHLTERHHLAESVPDDVNLLDVMEMLCDCCSAGMSRTGTVFKVEVESGVLQKAVENTVRLLIENMRIVEEDK